MNSFNEKEFLDVCKILNATPDIKEITIEYQRESFFNKMKNSIKTDRRGEVVFCVIRPNNKVIMITCSGYPDGIYRIPTGGIGYDEDIISAVHREVKEELGLDVEIASFAGALKIRFQYKNDSAMFYSYVFILKETGGRLLIDALDDEIGEVREVDINGLEAAVKMLPDIEGTWHDWGMFRFYSSNAVLNYLKKNFPASY